MERGESLTALPVFALAWCLCAVAVCLCPCAPVTRPYAAHDGPLEWTVTMQCVCVPVCLVPVRCAWLASGVDGLNAVCVACAALFISPHI